MCFTSEAEYMVASEDGKEVVYIRVILQDFGWTQQGCTHMFGYTCDQVWQMGVNLSAVEYCASITDRVYLCILLVWVTLLLKNRYETKEE